MTVIGIILIVGSFGGFMSGEAVAAAVVLALGVLLLVLGIRRKKKKQQAQPTPQQPPVYQPPVRPHPTPQPAADPQPADKKTEKIKVAGVNYHKDAVESLGHENDEYQMSKKEIIENDMEDQDIFEYYFRTLPAEFRFEPDNPRDPNAIAIDVLGEHIGYVKSGSTAHIRKLINEGRIAYALCDIYGGKCKRYDSSDETIEKETHDYAATVTITLKS